METFPASARTVSNVGRAAAVGFTVCTYASVLSTSSFCFGWFANPKHPDLMIKGCYGQEVHPKSMTSANYSLSVRGSETAQCTIMRQCMSYLVQSSSGEHRLTSSSHAVYTIPVAIALTVLVKPLLTRLDLYKIGFLITVAVIYTIPWCVYCHMLPSYILTMPAGTLTLSGQEYGVGCERYHFAPTYEKQPTHQKLSLDLHCSAFPLRSYSSS